jgi:hypothetical protein
LHDGREVELVACAGEAAQPQPLEAVMGLQMCKAHLDPLPLVTRPGERLRLHLPASYVAGILVKIARDPARLVPGAAPRPQKTDIAVSFRGAVEQRAPVVHRAAGAELLPVGADVVATPLVPDEVSA